jgi:hypothetical protein
VFHIVGSVGWKHVAGSVSRILERQNVHADFEFPGGANIMFRSLLISILVSREALLCCSVDGMAVSGLRMRPFATCIYRAWSTLQQQLRSRVSL